MYQFSISNFAYYRTYIGLYINNNLVEYAIQEHGPNGDEDENTHSHTFTQVLVQGDELHFELYSVGGGGYIYIDSQYPVTIVGALISEDI